MFQPDLILFYSPPDLGTSTYVQPKNALPTAVVDFIKQVFTSLSSLSLLQKTQWALTQNANESLHHVIWSLAPKDQYNSNAEVSLAINLAVMRFNTGLLDAYQHLFKDMEIPLTVSAKRSFYMQDKKRPL